MSRSAAEVAAAAAAPVDDKIDTDPLSINFEREKTAKPTAAERMLAGPTIDWLIAFPFESRPKALCERVSACGQPPGQGLGRQGRLRRRACRRWSTTSAGARAGFPAQVLRRELQRLLALLA